MTTRQRTVGLGALLVVYLGVAAAIGFWATPVDASAHRWVLIHLARWHASWVRDFVDYSALEVAANVLFFVPLGVLVAAMLPRQIWWLSVVIGVAFSVCIEVGQLLFLPGRFASWDDILANSVGTAVGAVIVLIARALARSRSRSRSR